MPFIETRRPLRDGNRTASSAYVDDTAMKAAPEGTAFTMPYGVVVLSVNVSVFASLPVRRASLAPRCWLKPIATAACETGADHDAGVIRTCSGSGSETAPL